MTVQASVVGDALLRSPTGWHCCNHLPSTAEVVGVDRHGKLAVSGISISATAELTRAVFIGTSLCCGAFSCNSRLQDIDGKSWGALNIVQEMTIGDLRFEVVLDSGLDDAHPKGQIESLWQALCCEAVNRDHQKLWIRLRQPTDTTIRRPRDTELCSFEVRGDRIYSKLQKKDLSKLLERGRRGQVMECLGHIFTNDDNYWQLNRASSVVAMDVASNWLRDGKAARMMYDSLQHSVEVLLSQETEQPAVARGQCAFVMEETVFEWKLSWEAHSWNPICNGLVLLGK